MTQKLLRGMGTIYRRRHKNRKKKWVKSKTWWIMFYHNGRKIRKASGTENRGKAIQFLKKQLEMSMSGKMLVGQGEKMKFATLAQFATRDYTRNKRKSLDRLEDGINHLQNYFGSSRAADINSVRIDEYVSYRLEVEKAANATVRYELSALKRMFRLAEDILGKAPRFPVLHVANARTGFFEESDFVRIMQVMDPDIKPAIHFAYLTGWRLKSEIFSLQWNQVDFHVGEVRLEPGKTKSGEGRTFPFGILPEVEEILRTQRACTDRVQRERNVIIPWVFHRSGRRIADIRDAWREAIEASGIANRIPHDFRRTAVRNLERSGVPRSVAMKLVGHKTESIYRRYAIVAPHDLVDGVKRLAEFREAMRAEGAKVASIAKKDG